jgi:hypothetical protein
LRTVYVHPSSFITYHYLDKCWDSRSGHCNPTYLLNRRLGGPQSRYWLCAEEKNLLPLPGIEPRFRSRSALSLVIYWLSLLWVVELLMGRGY